MTLMCVFVGSGNMDAKNESSSKPKSKVEKDFQERAFFDPRRIFRTKPSVGNPSSRTIPNNQTPVIEDKILNNGKPLNTAAGKGRKS